MIPQETYEQAIRYYEGKEGIEQCYTKAYALFLEAAEAGSIDAQAYLGRMLCMGEGVTKNDEEAVKWLRLAAEGGNADAQYRLAIQLQKGKGVVKNIEEAIHWYLTSADQGYAKAQCKLGHLYMYGTGVEENYEEAHKWLRLAVAQNDHSAQWLLGVMYQCGKGVSKDYTEAISLYKKAAEDGHVSAMLNLGNLYIGQNKDEAYKWLTKAAEAGKVDAMMMLGRMYYNEKRYDDSEIWLKKAVAEDNTESMCILAGIYLNKARPDKAYSLYRKAAMKGSKKARRKLTDLYNGTQHFDINIKEHIRLLYIWKDVHSLLSLAYLTMEGIGIKADAFEAVRLWKTIHQQGYKMANYNLAVAHYYGIGIDKDTSKAKEYLSEILEYDNLAPTMLSKIEQSYVEKPVFHLYSPDIVPDSMLEAEMLSFSDNYVKAEKIYKKTGTGDSYFQLARYYKHDKDEVETSNIAQSKAFFDKAIALCHPYALHIKSLYGESNTSYDDYDLYSPYFINDIVDYCFPEDYYYTIWDLIYVFWAIVHKQDSLEDMHDFTYVLRRRLHFHEDINNRREQLFRLCKLKSYETFIEECREYIWNTLEKGNEASLQFPSKSFIDGVNSQLKDSQSVTFYEGASVKFLKFLDKDKRYYFHATDRENEMLVHFLVDLMAADNVSIKASGADIENCDTVVLLPNLSVGKNFESTLRERSKSLKSSMRLLWNKFEDVDEIGDYTPNIQGLRRVVRKNKLAASSTSAIQASGVTIKSVKSVSIAEWKKKNKEEREKQHYNFSQAILLINKEFASSVLTDISRYRAHIIKSRTLESVIEFPKETFSDIETTTSLLHLNFEETYKQIRFIKNSEELLVDYKTLRKNDNVLCYDIYLPQNEEIEGIINIPLKDIMSFRTVCDKNRKDQKVRILSNQNFHNSLLNAVSKADRFTCLKDDHPSPILKEYRGPHIFLKYDNGVRIHIQTDDEYCYPKNGVYAIKLRKDSPVSLEYLAYLLLSDDIANHMASIIDKNNEFMVRDMLYKHVSIHKSKSKQKEVVEKALLDERMRIDEGLKYNIVVLSKNTAISDLIDSEVGFSRFAFDETYDEICNSQIFNSASELIDAIIIDADSDEFADVLEDFSEIRQKGIHLYVVSDKENFKLQGRKKVAYFVDGKRVFTLNTEGVSRELIMKMREDLDSSNAAQAKIRNKYKNVFEAADALDRKYPHIGISKAIVRYVIAGCNIDDVENTAGPCGSFRQVCHELLKLLISKRLIPDNKTFRERPGTIPSLLESGSYYDKQVSKKAYVIYKPFMSNYLSKALEYFCKVTNEGVHGSQDSSRLGTAALNILMEFILWFYENDILNNNLELEPGQSNWRDVTDQMFSHNGKVYTVKSKQIGDNSYFYAENIHIEDKQIKEGTRIKINRVYLDKIGDKEREKNGNEYIVFYTSDYTIL